MDERKEESLDIGPRGSQQSKLEEALKKQVNYYRKGTTHSKNNMVKLRFGVIALSAMTTIVVGLDIKEWDTYTRNVALVLSAVVTALGSVEALLDHRGKWLLAQEVYMDLINLRARYYFDIEGAIDDEKDNVVRIYWGELQEIITNAHKMRIEGLKESVQ